MVLNRSSSSLVCYLINNQNIWSEYNHLFFTHGAHCKQERGADRKERNTTRYWDVDTILKRNHFNHDAAWRWLRQWEQCVLWDYKVHVFFSRWACGLNGVSFSLGSLDEKLTPSWNIPCQHLMIRSLKTVSWIISFNPFDVKINKWENPEKVALTCWYKNT